MTRPFVFLLCAAMVLAGCEDELQPDGILAKNEKCKEQWGGCEPPPPPPGPVEPNFAGPPIELHSPVRVATTETGWLLVSETHSRAIARVNPTTLIADQSFAVDGRPHAVGMLGDRIYVGNMSSSSVEIFDATGSLVGYLGAPGSIVKPMDLAIDTEAGLIFVLARGAGEVRVYQSDGTPASTIGTGGLVMPTSLSVNPAGQEVVISDAGPIGGNASVVVYGYDGMLVTSFTDFGTCGMLGCKGGFSTPGSVAVDSLGRVYVLDVVKSDIMVYNRDNLGTTVQTLDGGGTPLLRFPLDIAVAGVDVVVTSKLTHSVEAFRGVLP